MNELVFTAPLTPLTATPDPAGEVADEALYGMTATLLGEEKGRYKVRMRYRYEGYVATGAVSPHSGVADWESSAAHRVIAPSADVVRAPSFQSFILATLPRGASLSVGAAAKDDKGAETDWLAATLADGTAGYVRRPSVRPARAWEGTEEVLRARVAADARLYLGTQYRWGGKSPAGIDCSGLAAMAYMLNGLCIYRDARIVEGFPVKEIPANRAKLADLLFWPGHVAVYLGEGRYVHSTGFSSGVVENSLDPKHADYRADLANVEKWGSVFGR